MPKKNPTLCGKIREDVRKWDDYWRLNIQNYHETTQFVMGDQWREDEARVFETYKKIPLTFNKLASLTNHLLGEQRQNTPQLQIYPEDLVPEKTAEVRQALIKDISLSSDAKVIYQNAFQQAAIGGFGAFRIGTDYESEYSFNQDIKLHGFRDPTRCFWDLSAEDSCKVLGMHSGFRNRMSRKKFRNLYGKNLERTIGSSGNDDSYQGFWDDDQITIIDYYKREYEKDKIYQLSNGETVSQEEFDLLERINIDGQELLISQDQPVTVENSRITYNYKIKHYKIAGDYVLESADFPSESLPVVFVDQNSYFDKHGRQICRPIVKDARDSQRFINFLGTQIAYLIKISRNDQFIVSKANVKSPDTKQIWKDPSVVQGGLIYDESPNGNVPQQLKPPEISQSLLIQYQRAENDIHTTMGMYDTQLGNQGNEVSGAAIDARTKRGSYNNYVTFDSLNRAISVAGKIINEMIPKVYDTERQMMLYMQEDGMKPVSVNQPQDDYGMIINNDMRKGRYKIRLQPGPSYEGQKMEGLESLQMILQANPQLFSLIADLYAENLPLANNIEIKNRLKTIVSPEVIEAGKTGKPVPQKPSPEEQAQQMQAQQQQAMLKLKEHELMLKEKEILQKMNEANQKAQAELQRIETERLEAAAGLQEQELRYMAELNKTQSDANISHANNLVKILTHNPKK